MDSEQFDAVVKALATTGSRRRVLGGLLAVAVAGLRPAWPASAQEEIAASGNGGAADAPANGGAVATGDGISGDNAGNVIGVSDTVGRVEVDGGASANATSLDVAADGGTAVADASGGDENLAFLCDCPVLACQALLGCDANGQCRYAEPITCPPGSTVDEVTCTCASVTPVTCPNPAACDFPNNRCGPAGSNCACWTTTEGGALCGQDELCAAAPVCASSADCPPGQRCTLTCCGLFTCSLPCGVVRTGAAMVSGMGTRGGWKTAR
jgi:hypothetical protein